MGLTFKSWRVAQIRKWHSRKQWRVHASGFRLSFEPQPLSCRLPAKVHVLRADLIALNLNEASHRIADGSTGRWGAVHKSTGMSGVQHQLAGDHASSGVLAANHFEPQ